MNKVELTAASTDQRSFKSLRMSILVGYYAIVTGLFIVGAIEWHRYVLWRHQTIDTPLFVSTNAWLLSLAGGFIPVEACAVVCLAACRAMKKRSTLAQHIRFL